MDRHPWPLECDGDPPAWRGMRQSDFPLSHFPHYYLIKDQSVVRRPFTRLCDTRSGRPVTHNGAPVSERGPAHDLYLSKPLISDLHTLYESVQWRQCVKLQDQMSTCALIKGYTINIAISYLNYDRIRRMWVINLNTESLGPLFNSHYWVSRFPDTFNV